MDYEAKFFAGYLLAALLTFGYAYNADYEPPSTAIVNGHPIVTTGIADNTLRAMLCGVGWPVYWTVTAFKPFRPAKP